MVNHQAAALEQDIKLIQHLFPSTCQTHRLVTFSPVEKGNGASWVVSRAARALAEHAPRRSVCVVDADLRFPSQHLNFAADGQIGLAQAIFESIPVRSSAQQVAANLWMVPAGTIPGEPYRLLLSDSTPARLEELRLDFDYVLIDTPPASAYRDAAVVGRWTDGIVLVIEAGSTRHETASRARDEIQAAKVPVIGAILNKRTFPIPESLYRRL